MSVLLLLKVHFLQMPWHYPQTTIAPWMAPPLCNPVRHTRPSKDNWFQMCTLDELKSDGAGQQRSRVGHQGRVGAAAARERGRRPVRPQAQGRPRPYPGGVRGLGGARRSCESVRVRWQPRFGVAERAVFDVRASCGFHLCPIGTFPLAPRARAPPQLPPPPPTPTPTPTLTPTDLAVSAFVAHATTTAPWCSLGQALRDGAAQNQTGKGGAHA